MNSTEWRQLLWVFMILFPDFTRQFSIASACEFVIYSWRSPCTFGSCGTRVSMNKPYKVYSQRRFCKMTNKNLWFKYTHSHSRNLSKKPERTCWNVHSLGGASSYVATVFTKLFPIFVVAAWEFLVYAWRRSSTFCSCSTRVSKCTIPYQDLLIQMLFTGRV